MLICLNPKEITTVQFTKPSHKIWPQSLSLQVFYLEYPFPFAPYNPVSLHRSMRGHTCYPRRLKPFCQKIPTYPLTPPISPEKHSLITKMSPLFIYFTKSENILRCTVQILIIHF